MACEVRTRISHSAASLEALTVTSSPWTEALIPRASSEYKHVLCASQSPPRSLQARIPSFEQRHGCRTRPHCRLPGPPPSPFESSM